MINRAESVQILVGILVHEEGGDFFSHLERKDTELCIEILDHVSHCSPYLPPLSSKPDFRESQNTSSTGSKSGCSVLH